MNKIEIDVTNQFNIEYGISDVLNARGYPLAAPLWSEFETILQKDDIVHIRHIDTVLSNPPDKLQECIKKSTRRGVTWVAEISLKVFLSLTEEQRNALSEKYGWELIRANMGLAAPCSQEIDENIQNLAGCHGVLLDRLTRKNRQVLGLTSNNDILDFINNNDDIVNILEKIWSEFDNNHQAIILEIIQNKNYEQISLELEEFGFIIKTNGDAKWFSSLFPVYVIYYHTTKGKILRGIRRNEIRHLWTGIKEIFIKLWRERNKIPLILALMFSSIPLINKNYEKSFLNMLLGCLWFFGAFFPIRNYVRDLIKLPDRSIKDIYYKLVNNKFKTFITIYILLSISIYLILSVRKSENYTDTEKIINIVDGILAILSVIALFITKYLKYE